MSDQSSETKRIQPTHGPYAGSQIDIPKADAEQAIADGWAIDPFEPIDPDAEPKEWTQEGHDAATAAAEKAARKIRGEPEPEGDDTEAKPAKAKAKAGEAGQRNVEAGEGETGYHVRETETSAPRRGRPPKSASDE